MTAHGIQMTGETIPDYSDSIDDGNRPLSTPFTTLLSKNEVTHYLDEAISDDVGLIISTVRKGSWIIEDYLRRTERKIPNITSHELSQEGMVATNILLFDDSIHTGNSIMELHQKIPNGCTVKVVCLAINDDATRMLTSHGIDDIRCLRSFQSYESFRMDGEGEKELLPDCQSYYYSHFIIPYISGLSFNYSPDYRSISIRIASDTSDNMDGIMGTVLDSIDGITTESYPLYRDSSILRVSAELTSEFITDLLHGVCEAPFEYDMGKMRISVTVWAGCIELVITPIISFRIKTDDDLEGFLSRCSDNAITEVEGIITERLGIQGYTIMDSRRFQADKSVRWE